MTFLQNKIETRDEIISKSFIQAVDRLEKRFGNIENWQWGKLHQVTFKHFFHGKYKILDMILDVGPFEIGGDGTTVFNTEYSFTKPYENKLGPSMRFIYDFAEREKFEIILPSGQSGHFYSKHYSDMTKMWLKGDNISINTNENFVKSSGFQKLKLIPISN